MAELNDVTVSKSANGLGRQKANTDNIRGLVLSGGAAAPAGLAFATSVPLLSKKAAEALGITAAYDTTNEVLVHYHVAEFFRMNPNGKLWLRLVAQTVTMAEMVDNAAASPCAALQLQLDAGGEIKSFGIGRNPAADYVPVVTDGLDADVLAAVPKAQALADRMWTDHTPGTFYLEGRSWSGNAATTKDLRTMASPNVVVVISQDRDVASNADNTQTAHACIGTVLGTSSKAKVGENIGWVERFPVASTAEAKFLNPGFSGNLALSSLSAADLGALNEKGYVFLRTFPGVAGCYFNDSHTCTEADSDYAYQENNEAMNKAHREVYKKLVPKTNAPIKLAADGTLPPEVVMSYESLAMEALNTMEMSDEISAYDVYIDPAQNLLSDSTLDVEIEVVPIGTNRKMRVTIGFTQRISTGQ